MPVSSLEKWTATALDNGLITLTSWQPPTNLIPGFATGKKTEQVKSEDGTPDKESLVYHEHKFTVKSIQLYPPVGGWTVTVTGSNCIQYTLALSEKNRYHTAVVSAPKKVETVTVDETLVAPNTSTGTTDVTADTAVPVVAPPTPVATTDSATKPPAKPSTKPYKNYRQKQLGAPRVSYVAKQSLDELHSIFKTTPPTPPKKVVERVEIA